MGARRVVLDGTYEHWRGHARAALAEGVTPGDVRWVDPTREALDDGGLFGAHDVTPTPVPTADVEGPSLPRALLGVLATVACHSDPSTWSLLYRVVWRATPTGAVRLHLDDALDADVVDLRRREKAVRRDAHKMHAFVRFRRVDSPDDVDGERFVAFHRPLHRIVEREASFFRARFPSMAWSILTPFGSAHWDTRAVTFGPGCDADEGPDGDPVEDLWVTYYGAIFNPARVKLDAMRAEMPVHHWDTLPETRAIPQLLEEVPARLAEMARTSRAEVDSAAPFVPTGDSDLGALRDALPRCEGCELCRDGTRAVPGEGPPGARIVLLGEQPGDVEEREGRPFVGPAGRVLDACLAEAGLDRGAVYATNAVKHFRHRVEVGPVGKRRIHQTPTYRMVSRCEPWFEAEMRVVRPEVLVCLGVTAARAVFGPTAKLDALRAGPRASRHAAVTIVTHHPAAILRARGDAERLRAELVADLAAGSSATV